jgi:misacylated tRNA(Ala) deacylase
MSSQYRVVGELACQRDSYLRTIDTVVVACRETVNKTKEKVLNTTKGPKNPKSSKHEQSKSQQLWEIEFADSVLFPEGMLFCVLRS